MDPILIIPMLVSFLVTFLILPIWIKKAKTFGLVWQDMNKQNNSKASGSGGLIVIFGFIIGIFTYVAYRVFILGTTNDFLVQLFAVISVILILAGIGFLDDIFGWQKGGIRRRTRILLTAISAIPLVAINAGKSVVSLPFIGSTDLGIFYPLILIPLGIAGATTTYNFLAGFNGLEAGQGALLLAAISLVAFATGNSWLAVISLIMVAALLAFLLFNFYPAKVFPGDILTYSVGGLIAIVSILGDFEKVAVFFFIPYLLELVLKSRGKLIKQSFGKPRKDNTLELKYEKIYSLTHLSLYLTKKLGFKATEKSVVYSIWIFQIIIIILGFIIFREGIFGI
jgi:UDP-N-acetylglucosamine--dolichyl-phosphate N-acetylglucosaminephosphotransferase